MIWYNNNINISNNNLLSSIIIKNKGIIAQPNLLAQPFREGWVFLFRLGLGLGLGFRFRV